MSKGTIEARVRQRVLYVLGCGDVELTPDAHFVDVLGADSLDIVELAMVIEEEFELEISDDDIERHFVTLRAVVAFVEKLLAEPGQ